MTSEQELGLVAPTRYNPALYRLNTEQQAAEAFYSHEQLIRLGGRFGVVPIGDDPPRFEWTPSPTFGQPLPTPDAAGKMQRTQRVVTRCLRTEFVMIGYAYVVATVRSVLEQFNALCARTPPDAKLSREDRAAAVDFCKRLYNAYLVLVDRVKLHVLLQTVRNLPPACAELSLHTVDGMIAFVVALHALVSSTMLERTSTVATITRRDTCTFVARQFARAYSIFTQHVWPIYGANTRHCAQFQRYLLGSAIYYEARAMMWAVFHEKSLPQWRPTAVVVLARRIEYVFSFLLHDVALGYQSHAQKLAKHVQAWLASTLPAAPAKFPHRDRITTAGQYAAGEHLMALIFESGKIKCKECTAASRPSPHPGCPGCFNPLAIHYTTSGRTFRSNAAYCSLLRACLFQAPAQKLGGV